MFGVQYIEHPSSLREAAATPVQVCVFAVLNPRTWPRSQLLRLVLQTALLGALAVARSLPSYEDLIFFRSYSSNESMRCSET